MRWPVLIWALVAAGCSFSDSVDKCLLDEDCLPGYRCSELDCVPENSTEPGADFGVDATAPRDTGPLDMGQVEPKLDMASRPDMSIVDDSDVRDSGAPDLGEEMGANADVSYGGECVIDPFSITCVPDAYEPNGEFAGEYLVSSTVAGCPVNENFVGDSTTLQGELCRDDEDRFIQSFVQCEARSLAFEVIVRPLVDCDPAEWDLEVSGQSCAATNVQCEVRADGSKRISVIYPSVQRANVRPVRVILVGDTDLRLPYELSMEFR